MLAESKARMRATDAEPGRARGYTASPPANTPSRRSVQQPRPVWNPTGSTLNQRSEGSPGRTADPTSPQGELTVLSPPPWKGETENPRNTTRPPPQPPVLPSPPFTRSAFPEVRAWAAPLFPSQGDGEAARCRALTWPAHSSGCHSHRAPKLPGWLTTPSHRSTPPRGGGPCLRHLACDYGYTLPFPLWAFIPSAVTGPLRQASA